jgi:hypothetical protein
LRQRLKAGNLVVYAGNIRHKPKQDWPPTETSAIDFGLTAGFFDALHLTSKQLTAPQVQVPQRRLLWQKKRAQECTDIKKCKGLTARLPITIFTTLIKFSINCQNPSVLFSQFIKTFINQIF